MGPVGAYSAATYPQLSCFVWQQLPALQTSRARSESQPEYVLSDISPHPPVGRPRSHPFLPESEHSGPLERGKCDKSLCFRLLHPPERDVRFQTVSPPSASSASPRWRIRSSLGRHRWCSTAPSYLLPGSCWSVRQSNRVGNSF